MNRSLIHQLFLAVALVVLALPSCTSVQSLLESGNYEETIAVAQRRLTGKQKKNPKYVAALEEAVNKANERDVARAAFLREGGNPDWVRIHSVYDELKRRQDALRPLLPLMDKNGRKANFRFVRVEEMVLDAADRAAEQVYAEALAALDAGRRGDKAAARQAYYDFERTERYRPNYRESYTLATEAEQLGRVYIMVEVVNQSDGYLPRGFENELLRVRTTEMDDRWRTFDFERREVTYDYSARIVIRDIAVTPDRVSQRSYVDEREIVDGEEYVFDANGNVAKDTLGNDITRERRLIVQAQVLEMLQQKSAIVTGSVQLYDLRTQQMIEEQELTAEATFENYASTFRGDKRALSGDSRSRIGNQPRRFPSDETLILEAAGQLKPQLQQRLAASHRII